MKNEIIEKMKNMADQEECMHAYKFADRAGRFNEDKIKRIVEINIDMRDNVPVNDITEIINRL